MLILTLLINLSYLAKFQCETENNSLNMAATKKDKQVLPKLNSSLPKTALQFRQMIDKNIGRDIEPNKFIQIATYIAIQMCQEMKQSDCQNQQEYVCK